MTCFIFEIDGSKTYRGGGCELQKTKQKQKQKNKTKKKIYIYFLGKACKTKVRLAMHEPLRVARGKKGRGESRELGGRGGEGVKNPTVTYGYIVMLLMLLTFPHSLNRERSSY